MAPHPGAIDDVPMTGITHRRGVRVVLAASTALAVVAAVAAPSDAAARTFRNCTALHKVYPHGVAKSRAAAKAHGWEAKVSASLYKANKKMDRDRDGVACESY
jgi:hypothetical protein